MFNTWQCIFYVHKTIFITVPFQVQTITDRYLPFQTEGTIVESAWRRVRLRIHRVLFTVDGLETYCYNFKKSIDFYQLTPTMNSIQKYI